MSRFLLALVCLALHAHTRRVQKQSDDRDNVVERSTRIQLLFATASPQKSRGTRVATGPMMCDEYADPRVACGSR